MDEEHNAGLLDLTVDVVTAYLSKNQLPVDQVAKLIASVHGALGGVGQAGAVEVVEPVHQMTAAQARKLITPAGIISLIDNRPFRSMKRHVTTHGYTPASYREAFGLPADFPMVHPDYSSARSNLAKAMGLGSGGRKPAKAAPKGKPSLKPKAG